MSVRVAAAYLLAVLGGNASPSAGDIKNILAAGGVTAEDEAIEKIVSELSGKNVEELLAEGRKKLSSVPSGAAATSSAPASAPAAAAAPAAAPAPKKEEKKEESDEEMGFGLFD